MRIGMILDQKFPPDPRVENEAVTLIENGHEVFLFCVGYGSENIIEKETINNIKVHRVIVPKFIYSLSALAYSFIFYHAFFKSKISAFISEYEIDHLHIHDMRIARSVFNSNKKYSLPITLDLHENRPSIMKFYSHVNTFLGKLLIYPNRWKKFEFRYIKLADKVITVTDDAAEYYCKKLNLNNDKFCTVPNSVREKFYNNCNLDSDIVNMYNDNFTILYLGDTGSRRGLYTVLSAINNLKSHIPNLKFVIVGSSIEDGDLKNKVKELDLEKYVALEGWKDFKLFQSYIKSADIGICPIHRNLHHDTTYANKIFQYMSFGKPVIVSDCPAQEKLIVKYDSGLVFKDRDVSDLTEKIKSLYDDKELYNRQSSNAFTSIENHLKWEVLSQDLVSLYAND